MKKIFLSIVLLAALMACENAVKESHSPAQQAEKPREEFQQAPNYQLQIDSLTHLKEAAEAELEVLEEKFDFKYQDLNGRSYYHKNWWGQYFISDQAVLAGVDSLGGFFLIANVWTYSHRDTRLDTLHVEIDGAGFSAVADSASIYREPLLVVCACGFHQAFFSKGDARKIGRMIAENPRGKIRWTGIKRLTKRDLVGIQESYELSEKILQVAGLVGRIEALEREQKQ